MWRWEVMVRARGGIASLLSTRCPAVVRAVRLPSCFAMTASGEDQQLWMLGPTTPGCPRSRRRNRGDAATARLVAVNRRFVNGVLPGPGGALVPA